MAKYFAFLFLNLGTVLVTNTADTKGKSAEYKPYPLILFETSDNALRRPFNLEEGQGFLLMYKTYQFIADESKAVLLFCGATAQNQIEIEKVQKSANQSGIETDVLSKYCLFERKESMLWSMTVNILKIRTELPKCTVEPEPFISKIFLHESTKDVNQKDGNHAKEAIRCGPGNKGELYRYGYQIWLEEGLLDKVQDKLDSGLIKSKAYPYKDLIDYEIYRFCYDRTTKEVLYTQHKMISPKLLHNYILRHEATKHYDISSKNFDLEELNFEELANKYSKYLKEEEEDNAPNRNTVRNHYKVEQLVPESDFAFALWRKPTAHYLNVDLIREELLDLWNHIVNACQTQARKSGLEYNVYTKTFNMQSSENQDEFEIMPESPQVWIKIIHLYKESDVLSKVSRAVAFIANNEMDEKLNEKISQTYCNEDHCKTFPDFQNDKYADIQQYVKCCAVNEEIEKLFNLDHPLDIERTGNVELVHIEGLYI